MSDYSYFAVIDDLAKNHFSIHVVDSKRVAMHIIGLEVSQQNDQRFDLEAPPPLITL